MKNCTALGAHGRILCSSLALHHSNRSLCAVMEKEENVKGHLEKGIEKVSEVLQIKNHSLLCN